MRNIVIMPGGFHPFHAGHASLYKSALKAFPGAEVYVAATNDTKTRPFPFAIKEKLAKLAGVAPGHFIQVKSPFQPREITGNYNPEQDVVIFVRSEKDKNEQPKPGGTKKDGTPAYFQPWTGKDVQPFGKHAYISYLPTVEFGPGITSATEIRNAWPKLDDRRKTAMVMSLYPVTQKNPKLAANVVKMLDMGMGEQEGVAEGPEFDKWADERVASQLHKLKPATYLVSVMDPVTGEHWRIEVKVTSPEMAKERAEAMGYKVLRVKEKEGVAEGSLNEFAADGFGDGGDNRSKLLASVGRLFDAGNKVDWQVPGQMGHVTRVQDDGITMKKWKMPRSKMSFFLPMRDDSRDSKYTIKMVGPKHYAVVSAEQTVAEGASLSVEELAHISDKALDDAYHYGRSTPGANFGWLANLQSAKAAKRLIDAGETDIEKISDAIHKGWNVTAAADYKGQLQLDTPTPEDKKLKRAKLAMQSYSQLPEEEKEKDRVVARALLQAIKGDTLSEGPYVQRIVHPNKINLYLRVSNKKPPVLMATELPYNLFDKFVAKVIEKYPQFKETDFSFKSADKVIAEENDEIVDPELHKMLNYAKVHYPNSPNTQVAFMKFVQRALKHSEQADTSQDTKLGILDKEVDQLQRTVSKLSNVTESADYLEEK